MDKTIDRRAFLAACGVAASAVGCKTPGDPMVRETDGVLKQAGVAEVLQTADGIQVVYPRPFSAVPTRVVGEGKGSIPAAEVEILDQKPDHFRFRWKRDGGLATLSWRAEGAAGAVPSGGR